MKTEKMRLLPFSIAKLFLVGCLLLSACKKSEVMIEEPTVREPCEFISLKFDGATCAFDSESKTFYYPISMSQNNFSPLIEVEEPAIQLLIRQKEITVGATNNLGEVPLNEALPIELMLCDETKLSYQLVFTKLPIIQITTAGASIPDEPKVAVNFELIDPSLAENEGNIVSTIGIEIRGGSAQSYDKKAYSFELWENATGADTHEEKLLDIRKDDDWILDGMSNDVSRMRNRVSMDIWRNFSQLPYLSAEPKAKNGTTGQLVELFIDEEYRGVYALSDRIDRKLLKIKKFENGPDFGMLYKSFSWGRGVVTYKNYYDFDPSSAIWEGWEQKYPDPEKEGIFWEPIADFTKFAVTSSDELFVEQIADYLDLSNAIDYFIFLNLIRGDDNTGKNMYMAKYTKDTPFLMIPWDVDATWGLFWDRTRTKPDDVILSNHLFNRLIELNPDGFRTKLKDRWVNARNAQFTQSKIISYFDNYAAQMISDGSFEREKQKWNIETTLQNELVFIDNWVGKRLVFLDGYFDNL